MATREQMEKLINSVIDIAVRNNFKDYERYFNDVINASSILVNEKVSRKMILEEISKIKIPMTAHLRQVYNMNLLASIGMVSGRTKMSPEEMADLINVQRLVKRYPVSNPKKLAHKIDVFSKAYLTGAMAGLSPQDLEIYIGVKKYYDNNREFIKEQLKINEKNLINVHKMIRHNISKDIVKDMKKLINGRIVEEYHDAEGVVKQIKRPRTVEEIRGELITKYGNQTAYRVNRIVNTEMHDLHEKTELNTHLLRGYTHKTWRTQGDSRVRPAKKQRTRGNHRAMEGKTIPIKDKFKVVGGGTGLYPSDPNLPAYQRINCRCYLTYEKR